MPRPVLTALSKAAQAAARTAWRGSAVGRIIESARREQRSSISDGERLGRALQDLQRGGLRSVMSSLQGESFNGLVAEIAKINSKSSDERWLLRELLRQLGPAGKVISAIATAVQTVRPRRTTGDADLDGAREFLESLGYTTLTPPNTGSGNRAQDAQAAAALLREHGYEVDLSTKRVKEPSRREQSREREEGKSPAPTSKPSTAKPKSSRELIEVETGTGKHKFPANHPVVTGEAQHTRESSTIWAFSYDVDRWQLWIRFDAPKTDDAPSKRPGSLYVYAHVPPDVFLAMMAAPSKGTFLWDRIRIRGTQSGHSFDYRLMAIREGYLPRKATLKPDGEWFIRRTFQTINRSTGQRRIMQSRPSAPVLKPRHSPGV